jgi:hypothetical protein
MLLDPTPENRRIADATASRLRADTAYVRARSLIWGMLGFGGCVALTGIGAGAFAYGLRHAPAEGY